MERHERMMAEPGDDRMDELLGRARRRVWTGADHSPRVEEYLRGIRMDTRPKFTLSRSVLVLAGVGLLAGGSLAAVVTHSIMTRRAVLVTDDGSRYEVELLDSADGASGTFVADDGTVFGIEMTEEGGQNQVVVDVTSPNGGTSGVDIEGVGSPRVMTLPGQTATISISESADSSDDESGDDGDE